MSMRETLLLRLRAAAAFVAAAALLCTAAFAAEALIPVGEAVGIRLDVDGALVAGVSEIETETGVTSPAAEAGVRAGDVIVAVNGRPVDSAASFAAQAAAMTGGTELTLLRGDRQIRVTVTPAADENGGARFGLWLRDGVTGVGTVTYIDPATGAFGALGHGVNDPDSGALLPADGGGVYRARVVDVTPGAAGTPGELAGMFSAASSFGTVASNTVSGVFGTLTEPYETTRRPVEVAPPDEVVSGPATILACVDGQEAREYAVEISRSGILGGGDGRDLAVRVTDPALLALTGGIVQGMSGSPILQNGRLVGAVTHVLTADPTRGYGIYIDRMLQAS